METLELEFENASDAKLLPFVQELHGKVNKLREFKKKFLSTVVQAEILMRKKDLLLYFAKLLQMIYAKVLQM